MTVYVESNFVLEIALGQEQVEAAETILARAEQHEIALAIPAFALSEPFSTVTHRSRNLQQIGKQFGARLREIARSLPHETEARSLASVPAFLASIERRGIERLTTTAGASSLPPKSPRSMPRSMPPR